MHATQYYITFRDTESTRAQGFEILGVAGKLSEQCVKNSQGLPLSPGRAVTQMGLALPSLSISMHTSNAPSCGQ